MEFNEYQRRTAETAVYPGQGSLMGILYTALGLGEVGEIQGKIKKILRDSNGIVTEETRQKIAAEIGDANWYLSQLCTELRLNLDEVVAANLAKLADRKARGVIQGSGDAR